MCVHTYRSRYDPSLQLSRRFYSTSTLPSKQLGSTLLRKNVAPKPAVIRLNPEDYKGPTFNCRVLNPNIDGSATKNHDPSCPLSFSEFSANGTCRCYYKISSRDENGCAIGFFYACKPLWNKNVAV
ncbi:hypothetical protein DICVIV_07862 [Dictyocaulus viviparus]|uniref:Uncharacterized protein n=1 Tax=Dictyocaulus viviparus TaxID=29172 RepID=A0A0D8XQQ0_DICVI|nr:hypothetical protein DICVIV_07862 [Dictyocaulus viviparus]